MWWRFRFVTCANCTNTKSAFFFTFNFNKMKKYESFKMKKYEILKHIGEGSFGQVYKARKRSDGEIVAFKMIRKVYWLYETQERFINNLSCFMTSTLICLLYSVADHTKSSRVCVRSARFNVICSIQISYR